MKRWPTLRFSVRALAVLMLGVLIGLAIKEPLNQLKSWWTPFGRPSRGTDEYVIEPPDILELTVRADPASKMLPGGRYLVGPDGAIHLGPVGSVAVAGSTVQEARLAIQAKIRTRHANARVALQVREFNSKVYYTCARRANSNSRSLVSPSPGMTSCLTRWLN